MLSGDLHVLSCLTVSWSPKGKQLALAATGTLSESTANSAATNSTSIVQVDHDLKVKRIIPIDALLKQCLKGWYTLQQISVLSMRFLYVFRFVATAAIFMLE